jgi:hypothetical protein
MGVTNPTTRVLNPGQQLPIVDIELFGASPAGQDTSGWIRVERDVDGIAGFFLQFNSSLKEMDGGNLSSTPLDYFVLPEIQDQGFTKVNITNANDQPVTLVFDLVKAYGLTSTSATRMIPANGALVADVFSDLFSGVTPVASDYIRVRSSKGVMPFEMMGKPGQDMAMLSGVGMNSGGSVLYSPQYVVGGPWRSTLCMINLDSVPGSLSLQFFGEDGTQIGASRELVIAGNGKVYINDQGFFAPAGQDVLQGYVKVTGSGIHLTGSITFGDVQGRDFTTVLPLVSTLQNSVLFGHIASDDIYFTGIALVNPNDAEARASIDIYGADGLLQGTQLVLIPARQRKSGLLTQFFSELVGQNRTSGYIKVATDRGVAGFALFGTHNLSVLSALPPQKAQ